MRPYYQILGVSPNATSEEIRAAWRFSTKAFHPDKFAGSSSEQQRVAHERTQAINEAYSVLSDPLKRAAYDRESGRQPGADTVPPTPAHAQPRPEGGFTHRSKAISRGFLRVAVSTSKYLEVLVGLLILLFVFIANFSTVETRFECKGSLTAAGTTQPQTVFVKLHEYRWWVGLWGDSDGLLYLEIPNEWLDFYPTKEIGDQLQIFEEKKLVGQFSTLSGTLALKTAMGFYDGTCIKIAK